MRCTLSISGRVRQQVHNAAQVSAAPCKDKHERAKNTPAEDAISAARVEAANRDVYAGGKHYQQQCQQHQVRLKYSSSLGIFAAIQKAQQQQKSESTPIRNSNTQSLIANRLLDGGYNYLLAHISNPPKVYGQYLQRTGKQKWTKKARKCKK